MDYLSRIEYNSVCHPEVRYTIARMSLGRRIELCRKVRELGLKGGFLAASADVEDRIEAGYVEHQINRTYLEWGLLHISGLAIDGEEATPNTLVDRGPEDLCREILDSIKGELHLTEEERKN